MEISVIIPCYNSEYYISNNLNKIYTFLKKKKLKSEIVCINDGSTDNTLLVLKKLKEKFNIKIINNKNNIGKSFSIIKGIVNSKYKNIILIDSDITYFKYLELLIFYLQKDYDLIIANRRLPESRLIIKNKLKIYQLLRLIIGKIIGKIIELTLNTNVCGDTQAGLKAFKLPSKFKKKKFISKRFFFDIELIHFFRRANLRIKSIPVKFFISDKSSIGIFNKINIKIIIELFIVITSLKRL
jgi:glycosyltransferase involved in cell wall biosynthesis